MRALLYSGNCFTCHKTTTAKSAPSISHIKKVYISAFSDKTSFVEYMSTWVLKPNAKTSLMSKAIKKYELMPEMAYDRETLQEISEYIYETDFLNE